MTGLFTKHSGLFLFAAILLSMLIALSRLTSQLAAQEATPYAELKGHAVLPADTFAPGPPSGNFIPEGARERAINNGRTPPFDSQPVQGISALIPKWNGNYLAMSDNGFGNKGNSPDYRLRWYEMTINFEASDAGIVGYTELSDPSNLIPWPIVNGSTDRVLTGADFDLESFQQAPDNTFWFGEEFGPYILHTDVTGRLIEAPIPLPYPEELAPFANGLPYVQSPDHPDFVGLSSRSEQRDAANLPPSRGLEGMAISEDGTKLYPMLEGALTNDPVRTRLLVQEFYIPSRQFTGNYWFYPATDPSHAIGEMTALNDTEYLVIERDSQEGVEAEFKHIYKIDLTDFDENRFLNKELVVDLLAIADPQGITTPEEGAIGFGSVFTFPFITIESVLVLSESRIIVVNDNNYPFSTGRRATQPDNTEFIELQIDS